MTVAQLKGSRAWPVSLIVSDGLLTAVALIASAVAARVAMTSATVLSSPKASPLALEFAPPDYTASWICLAVALVGLIAVVTGVAAARMNRSVEGMTGIEPA